MDAPDSHLDTDCLEIPIISANCSCDQPFLFLNKIILSAKIIFYIPFKNKFAISSDENISKTAVAEHQAGLEICQPAVANAYFIANLAV